MKNRADTIMTAGWVGLIAGVWLMLSAFFFGAGFMSTAFTVGTLVALFSVIELTSMESSSWVSWINGILGIWLIIAPFIGAMMGVGALWNSIVLGVVIILVSIWVGTSSSTMGMGHPKMG